jgi:hypothetical protein
MLAGCSETDPGLQKQRSVNVWMAQTLMDAQRDNALIAQHTLYAYHFIQDSPTLNDLGYSDLSVLASHYRHDPGKLSVRRQDASEDLYRARVAGVHDFLEKSGVQMERMVIEDVFPGGDGAPADRVLTSLEGEKKATAASSAPRTTSTAAAKSGEGAKR